MRYDQSQLGPRLAADYVLGLMPDRARRRFERVIGRNATLAATVAGWSERLGPLDAATEDIAPPAYVWRAIERRIGAGARVAATRPRANLRYFWRAFAMSAIAASTAIAIYIALNPTPLPTTVEALAEKIGLPGWVEAARHAPVDVGLSTMRFGISERERPRWIRAALLLTGDAQPLTVPAPR
jgi:anti-sigma-K factor RskA